MKINRLLKTGVAVCSVSALLVACGGQKPKNETDNSMAISNPLLKEWKAANLANKQANIYTAICAD